MENYEKESCELCENKFVFVVKRKHKCKRCERSVCANCSKGKDIIISNDAYAGRKHRVCEKCVEEIDYQKSFRISNKISWNINSKIALIWMNYLNINKKMDESKKKYKDYIEEYIKDQNLHKEEKQKIDEETSKIQDFKDFHLNYSFKEFYYYSQKDTNIELIILPIKNILYAFASKNKTISSVETMISIVSFLLCFACEEISFWIFDFLMNELCLNEFYQENTNIIEQEILVIKNLGKVFKIFIEEDENLINNFLSTHINVCFKTGFLNVLNFQTVYFIWDNMLSKGSFLEIEKALLATLKINLDGLRNLNDFSPKESLRLILNKTSFISFRKEFFFELSNELRNKYGGFPLKIKNKEILLKENTLSFQTDISIKLPSRSMTTIEPEKTFDIESNEMNGNPEIAGEKIFQNHEFTIMQLKKEKEKLNKVLEEKDFIINKLINENNERNSTCSQNIFDSIDFHLSEIKKEAESIFESSKRKIDSQSIFKNKNEPTMKKITDLKNKFEISCKVIVDLSNYFENNSDKLETLDFVSEKKHLNLLLNNVPIESENRELKNELCKQEDISSNVKLELNENKEIQNKYYPELNILKHKIQKKEKVKNKTKTKQLLQDKIEEYKKKIQKNSKVLKELNIVNEVLASNINKLNTERALMLEKQQITDEKFEKIIKVMKEEKEINKQKYSPLNKKYSSNPDHSDDDTHQYEKIIELKSSEIMQLNNQIKNLSIKILEEHNKNNFISKQKESVIESKNQEILNLKIDLNKIENKLQLQCEEFENLKRIHHAKLEKFDFLLEEKKNEIREIRKELRDAEDLINQERKIATSILDFSSTNNENLKEEKGERENDKIKNLEIENDKLKKDLRFIKKSLKETLDQNDSYSQDLQKIRLRNNLELKQKDQEIFKYRQMLERFDRIDSQNKMTQDLPERNKKNSLVTGLQNKQLDSHLDQKEAIFKNEIQENINAHQFLENTKLHSDQEVCKGCNLF